MTVTLQHGMVLVTTVNKKKDKKCRGRYISIVDALNSGEEEPCKSDFDAKIY